MNVQIPKSLYDDLVRFFLVPDLDEDEMTEIDTRIILALQEKENARFRRKMYSKFKTSSDPSEREAARSVYLNAVGISEQYRSSTPPEEPEQLYEEPQK